MSGDGAERRWVETSVCSSDKLDEVIKSVSEKVTERMARGEFAQENVNYLKQHRLALLNHRLGVDDQILERLRYLAKAWDVKLLPTEFKSHRPVIGPIIVFLKRMAFPVLAVFLRPLIQRQRDFNSTALELLTMLSIQATENRGETHT